MLDSRSAAIVGHYSKQWSADMEPVPFVRGPIGDLPSDFRVLRCSPHRKRNMWTYATKCMSQAEDHDPIELHMFAPTSNDDIIAELLVATAYYHRIDCKLGLGDTVNFGRSWIDGSCCDYGLISLPYLDGPSLEWFDFDGTKIRFLWLIPVTSAEVQFKIMHGVDRLEDLLEKARFNYLDPLRPSVV